MAKTTAFPEWVPVEERLPREGQYVLIVCGEDLSVALLRSGEWWGDADLPYAAQMVSHWMPLPDVPPERKKYRSPKRGVPANPLAHSKPIGGWVE
jgi:hypothetical protein